MKKAFVALVGAGPGDPGLLTVKALEYIRHADVVLYDRLVSNEILQLIPTGVTRIMVGKATGQHCVPQHEINQLLVKSAKKGRFIVRLKGGDPFCFGRGSEEALYLQQHGINFEIVPGITAATGCSAYAGIPLTHRGISNGVRFVTGHMKNNESLDLNWSKLADRQSTLVIYMGLANLQTICKQLIQHNLPASTPAAAIANGTLQNQQRVISTLQNLSADVQLAKLVSPVMVIIGRVVSLSEQLDWFNGEVDLADYENTNSL